MTDVEKSMLRDLWNMRREEMIQWLMLPIHGIGKNKSFGRKGAEKAFDNFVESMVFAEIYPPQAARP